MSTRTTSRSQDEKTVREWGFSHVFTWTDGPRRSYAHYPPHSHSGLTTHLIRRGSLTITYPEDVSPTKETFGVGARIDVPAGKLHEVWMGEEGLRNPDDV
ncbi:hypothetical protein AYO22_05226 [Fonsecaea multimorphosa]|nr:hypothetical protein AYO22_05226 [Fonsecaea multimorphosa]